MWFRALMGAAALLLVFEAACGDAYDGADSANDGGVSSDVAQPEAAAPFDAGGEAAVIQAPRCDHRAAFTKVERVAGLPNNAYCARITADESTAYFSVDNELRIAKRVDGGPFAVAKKLEKFGDKGTCPTLSADQRVLYFEEFFAILQQSGEPGGPYSAQSEIKGTPAPSGVGTPFLDEPRQQIYATYHLDPMNYFGNSAIGVTTLTGGSAGSFRRVDVGFGLDGGEGTFDAKAPPTYKFVNPVVSADGLAIYYTTLRSENDETADTNIWLATRASTATDFSEPIPVAGANSENSEVMSWLSPDNCRLYFSSDRETPGTFTVATFVATRAP